jgi:hypothetical protein
VRIPTALLTIVAALLAGCTTVSFDPVDDAFVAAPDCDAAEGEREATLYAFRTRALQADGSGAALAEVQWTSSHPDQVWLLAPQRIEAVALPDSDPWREIAIGEDVYAEFSGTVSLTDMQGGFELWTDHQGGLAGWLWADVDALCDLPDGLPPWVSVTVELDGASLTQRLDYR